MTSGRTCDGPTTRPRAPPDRRSLCFPTNNYQPTATMTSSAHLPAIEVLALFLSEGIDGDPHGLELEGGDPLVDGLGHVVDLGLELPLHGNGPLGGERLGGEAHIHDTGGVAVGGGQV